MKPEFVDGDSFKVVIMLDKARTQDSLQDNRETQILEFCKISRSGDEITKELGLSDKNYVRSKIIKPLLETGLLSMTLPDKPNSKNQKYVAMANYDKEN